MDLKRYLLKEGYEREGRYRLTGVVRHMGDIDFGHYTAECCDLGEGKRKWYGFNDGSVGEMGERDGVEGCEPYLLFYYRVG